MRKLRVATVLGTRPEIIKMSPLLPRFDEEFEHTLVHSGQHYSYDMDRLFFDELDLRQPDVQLEVGSHPPGTQTGLMMQRFEAAILSNPPDAVVVHGDTNTTLAGSLVAAKYRHRGVSLVHVEAGTRSHNRLQPEEINRRLIDQVSDLLFVPEQRDLDNLRREGIDVSRAIVTGNTVIESCRRVSESVRERRSCVEYGLAPGLYAVVTMHRQETVDDPVRLKAVMDALEQIGRSIPVLALLHPRTRKALDGLGLNGPLPGVQLESPVGYLDMVSLLQDARFCLTDSGGLVEEAAILRTPALVLRHETEHRQYVECGIHVLVGQDTETIAREATTLATDDAELERRRAAPVPVRTGAADRILAAMKERLAGAALRRSEIMA